MKLQSTKQKKEKEALQKDVSGLKSDIGEIKSQ